MNASLSQFNEGDRAFLALGKQFVPDKLANLLVYMPSSRRENISQLTKVWKQSQEYITDEREASLKGLSLFPKKRNLLYEADPLWIAEKLSGASAVLMAVVLSRLPKARVGAVLRSLPKETRRSLKSIQVSQIPLALQQWLIRRAELAFPQVEWPYLVAEDLFRSLLDLNWLSFRALLRELGLTELSLALGQMAKSSLRAILHRLPPREAKEIKQRIQQAAETSLQEQREAQLRLLTVDLEKPQPTDLIEEIGLAFLSYAFSKSDQEALEFFVHRFPPRQGYVLKRYYNEHRQLSLETALVPIRRKVSLALARSALLKE